MMSVTDIEKIINVLEAMSHYELLLSEFYAHNADIWTEGHVLWNNLALAEIRHADNIRKIKETIVSKPERFSISRPFNLATLNTVAAGLKDITKRLTLREFSCEKILIIARDIEQSIIEANYAEIVKTADIEYNTLMKDIISQTYEHKKIIQEKIAEMNAKA